MWLDLKTFNEFLLQQSGCTYQIFSHVNQGTKEHIKPLFFQKYQSIPNFLNRTSQVVSAPVFLTIIGLELCASAFVESMTALSQIAKGDKKLAGVYGGTAVISIVLAFVAFIAACLSPLINLSALVGGAVATVLAKPESDVTQQQMTKAI